MAGNPLFGSRIRELREAKLQEDPRRFTLRQFAVAVGISPTFLSKVERGEFDPPAADKIIKMAELLGVNADELLALARQRTQLHQALLRLGAQPRQLVSLAFLRGLSHEEIAEHTRLPLGTVKSQIRRALRSLRQTLGAGAALALVP